MKNILILIVLTVSANAMALTANNKPFVYKDVTATIKTFRGGHPSIVNKFWNGEITEAQAILDQRDLEGETQIVSAYDSCIYDLTLDGETEQDANIECNDFIVE